MCYVVCTCRVHTQLTLCASVCAVVAVDADYVVISRGQRGIVSRSITRAHLDALYSFKAVLATSSASALGEGRLEVGDLVLSGRPAEVCNLFGFWRSNQLKDVAERHGVHVRARCGVDEVLACLMRHDCNAVCVSLRYVFRCLNNPRHGVSMTRHVLAEGTGMSAPSAHVDNASMGDRSGVSDDLRLHDGGNSSGAEDCYMEVASEELKRAIIQEWEQLMSTDALREHVCCSCARRLPRNMMLLVKPGKIDFSLLRNDHLPEHILPVSYNRDAYGGAILNPKGLTSLDARADIQLCVECERSLRKGRTPKYALANWLYYGHDRLPADVKQAFEEATQVERVLVSRARASKISFRFCETKGHYLYGTDPHTSQSYVRGNVGIHPQDATHLHEYLPPGNDVIRDTICAVFVGQTKPTPETMHRLFPVLVRKSRVSTLIQFLTSHNPMYRPAGLFAGFSQINMDALFGPGTDGVEEGVPCGMEIAHVQSNEAIEGSTSSYVPGEDPPSSADRVQAVDELLMENVGYTDSHATPQNYRRMQMKALTHCLRGGAFLSSQAGSRFVAEWDNPNLLSWLFPHLDPWGIGGFFDPRRPEGLSFDEQLRYLLAVDQSPFRDDPDFAFVFYNLKQKRDSLNSSTFRVSASERENVVNRLLRVNVVELEALAARFAQDSRYKPESREEKEILSLLAKVNTISHDVPGSNGYKLSLRNEIRALINYHGTPTLFVTLNPSDRDNPLVRLYAGHDIDVEDAMRGEDLSRWQRSVLSAKNPSACARFFDKMINNFIKVILRFGRPGKGLFGRCKAYYGTVEAQARGTLHCHMLIWLEGHPSPQKLRDKLEVSDVYRTRMFAWLESVIKCELPGTVDVVHEPLGQPLARPVRSEQSGNPHPGAVPAPATSSFSNYEDFQLAYHAFVKDLVQEFNWHEHSTTCFKYAPDGSVPSDPVRQDVLCRMRIDGSTRPVSEIDPVTSGVLLRRLHPRIAAYNDLVIFLMKSNMDIKFIGSGDAAKAMLYYVTDYITKASLPTHIGLGALTYAIQKTNEKHNGVAAVDMDDRQRLSALSTTVLRMMSRQELSQQQVMSYLVGGGDVYRSHRFRNLYWGSFDRLFLEYFPEDAILLENVRGLSVRVPRLGAGVEGDADFRGNRDDQGGEVGRDDGGGPSSMDEFHDPVVTDEDVNDDEQDVEEESHNILGTEETFVLRMSPGSISVINQQQDYVYRPINEPFNSLSLYEFVSSTEKMVKASTGRAQLHLSDAVELDASILPAERSSRGQMARGEFSSSVHTQSATHVVRMRMRSLVPVILGNRTPRCDREPDEREAWARMMMILFVPWRRPSDLRNAEETWLQSYQRHESLIPAKHKMIVENMNVLSQCKDARDESATVRRAEAMAFLRDGVGSGREGRHSGLEDGDLPQGLDLFGSSSGAEVDLNPNDLESSCADLEAKVGPQVRSLLDACYQEPVGSRVAGLPGTNGSDVRIRSADDDPVLLRHSAIMKELRDLRRPQVSARSDDNPRPRKRRRLAREVEENLAQLALEEDVLRSSRAESSTGGVSGDYVGNVPLAIEQVVVEMGLGQNAEQERAFRLVANHVLDAGGQQLLMYIAGVGGTGKTHVVRAILRLFELLGRSGEILVGAPTGAAALNVDGYTIHSLTMVPTGKGNGKSRMTELKNIWRPVRYLIIDEISMIGALFLAKISKQLQLAKGEDGDRSLLPFGGLNVIFTGDFGQLAPVMDAELYKWRLTKNPNLKNIRSATGVSQLYGVYLWRQVNTVVELTRNQRQAEDLEYADLLGRVRVGSCRQFSDPRTEQSSDVEVLYHRLLQHVGQRDPHSLHAFKDAPIIVGTKQLRDSLNARLITFKARAMNAPVAVYHARDRIGGSPVDAQVRKALWKVPSSACDDALGRLPLFCGMKVMFRENVAFSRKLVNGAVGTVKSIVYDEEDGVRYASVVYVHVPGAGRVCADLERDVVPIFPVLKSFKCEFVKPDGSSFERSVSRRQLPLVPAYAYTDYKSQGKSLDYAIVDLDSAMSLQGAYVMLSRVRTIRGLIVLRPFSHMKISTNCSEQLRDEFARIAEDARTTRLRYERGQQRGSARHSGV